MLKPQAVTRQIHHEEGAYRHSHGQNLHKLPLTYVIKHKPPQGIYNYEKTKMDYRCNC
jgi:hypothetical protein